jgi:hypothetical protein
MKSRCLNMVRLRGHHLICLHFYHGEGYNDVFVENLSRVLKEAEESGVTLVSGGDVVCAACPSYNGELCTHQPGGEEKIQRLDSLASRLLKLETPILNWNEIKAQIPIIIAEWKKHACQSCEWEGVCEKSEAWNQIY